MITIKADGLQDGLYNIKNGKIFKYKAKGGTVRTYEMGEIVRCKDCKHRHLDGVIWNCPFGLCGGEDFFCAYGAKDGDSDDE